jgi:hypothetical protein
MANPQQPELGRSRKVPHQDPDSAAALVDAGGGADTTAPPGPVPPENQPGHHPEQEQDKPDLDAFAAQLGMAEPEQASPTGPTPAREADEGQGRPGPHPAEARPSPLLELALLPVRVPLAVLRKVRNLLP